MGVVIDSSTDRHRRTSGTMPVTTSDFTACGWFYFGSDVDSYSTIFCINNSTGTPVDGWYLQTQSDGTTLAIWDQDASAWYSTNIGTLTAGNWYHCAIRKNGTNLRGSFRLITTASYTTAICDNAPADTFTAANLEFGNTYSNDYANGTVSNWKIYQADLTDAELYQESIRFLPSRWTNLWAWYPLLDTSGVDYGGNGYSLNVASGVTTGNNPPISWAAPVLYYPVTVAGGTTHNATATLAGTSSAVTVGKNTIPFTATLAGTSSAVTVGKNTIPFTATLAGTSSAVTAGKNTIPYTATLAATSSAVTVGKNSIPYTSTLAGTSSAVTIGKNSIPYTSTLAGTSSLISVGNNINLFTTTLAGTSSLLGVATNTIPVTSTLAATSSAVTAGKNTIPYTSTLAGTSSLIGVGKNALPFTSTLAGTSILGVVGTINGLVEFTATLAGTSSLITVGKNTLPFTSTLAGTSTLTALGLRVLYLAITITATSSLESIGKNTIPYTITLAGTSSLTGTAMEITQSKSRFFRRYVQSHGRGDKQRG